MSSPLQQPPTYYVVPPASGGGGCFGCIGKAVVVGFLGLVALGFVGGLLHHSSGITDTNAKPEPDASVHSPKIDLTNKQGEDQPTAIIPQRDIQPAIPICWNAWELKAEHDKITKEMISLYCSWLGGDAGKCEFVKSDAGSA